MNAPLQFPVVAAYLEQLARRLRWKRWLARLSRSVALIALAFVVIYGVDMLYGVETMTLRLLSAGLLLGSIMLLLFDFAKAWFGRIDPIGVAQIAEKRCPDLAERLVTLAQVKSDSARELDPEFVYFLGIETEKQLAHTSPTAACPLRREQGWLAATGVVLGVLFGVLGSAPSFAVFSDRFFTAWETSLEPFVIRLSSAESYGGGTERIECDGQVIELSRLDRHVIALSVNTIMLDRHAKKPTECWLVSDDADGGPTRTLMTPLKAPALGQFSCEISNPVDSRRYRAEAGGTWSSSFLVAPIDRPRFTQAPTVVVMAPHYTGQAASAPIALEPASGSALDLLRYSRMQFAFAMKRQPAAVWLRVKKLPASDHEVAEVSVSRVVFGGKDERGLAEVVNAKPGHFDAELIVVIEHDLCVVLPAGSWTVHEDAEPRFTQPVRVTGGGVTLTFGSEYKIAPRDSLKVQTLVEDAEGLDAVAVEFRLNDGPAHVVPWQRADAKKLHALNDWLPLPTGLKAGDRVQFRLLASDNRRLKRGEIAQTKTQILPAEDLTPHITAWPTKDGDPARWITLRVDPSASAIVKDHVLAQADLVRDHIAKIRDKLVAETRQLEKVQRTVHQQVALAPEQKQQADKIRKLDREITEDLLRAGEHFAGNPELARLADYFVDIAETEMLQIAEALNRFSAKDRPLVDGEKDLQVAQNAVQQAMRKLDRMNDLNKFLAQDRVDHWQIEQLAHRQAMLAQKLKNLLENEPLSNAELARQIDAIRQEQAKLAEQRTELENQNALVKESAEAIEQEAMQRLAQTADKLAAEQRKMQSLESSKMVAEKADQLAADIKELAQKASSPEAKAMAKESAEALAQAKKAMDASAAMKAKGDAENAKGTDDEAAKKFDLVVKQLAKLAQDQAMKLPSKDGADKTAEALKDSGKLMKTAEDKLPAMPRDAQIAMKGAAQKLAQTAELAQQKASRHLPKVARNPNAKTAIALGGAGSSVSGDAKLETFQGKAWGELPGELKTRLLQDFRSRFGEEYADMIQQYFERLAEMPARKQ